MSDALLTEISKKLSDIHAVLSKGGAASGGATKPATPPAGGKAGAATPPNKPAGNKPAGNKPTAQAGNTKAAGGKYDGNAVKDIIRQVATNPALGKEAALNILDENGGGVKTLTDLKPEFFDAVYEACQVELSGAGSEAGGDPDDPLA